MEDFSLISQVIKDIRGCEGFTLISGPAVNFMEINKNRFIVALPYSVGTLVLYKFSMKCLDSNGNTVYRFQGLAAQDHRDPSSQASYFFKESFFEPSYGESPLQIMSMGDPTLLTFSSLLALSSFAGYTMYRRRGMSVDRVGVAPSSMSGDIAIVTRLGGGFMTYLMFELSRDPNRLANRLPPSKPGI